jgi:hypothetical protein
VRGVIIVWNDIWDGMRIGLLNFNSRYLNAGKRKKLVPSLASGEKNAVRLRRVKSSERPLYESQAYRDREKELAAPQGTGVTLRLLRRRMREV